MAVTLPIDVYETFEKNFGKEDAKQLVRSFETAIDDRTEYKWAVTRDEIISRMVTKDEFARLEKDVRGLYAEINTLARKEEISKLATKEEISKLATKEELNTLRIELMKEMEKLKAEIETKITVLDRKFTIMLVVLFFTIIFLNQNALAFLAKIFKLM